MISKHKIFILLLICTVSICFSQSIEITALSSNPLEVSPLLGADLTINYKYSSEAGATSNHIYIALELLNSDNNYVSTVADITLESQQAGSAIQNSVRFFIGSSNTLSANLPSGQYYQVKAILYASGGWTANAWAGHWNTPSLVLQDTSGYTFSTNTIHKGADISWMTEMESDGFTWKDNSGTSTALMPLLKTYNLDAVRLRVWVNPEDSGANGWCDINDLVAKAELAKANNMDVMVCIHYSDWWADPGQQTKPTAWNTMPVSQLETAVSNHTTNILTALSAKGITPKWVQIGNETNDGMLWPTGKASTGGFANYAKFLNAGANAVKTFNATIKTILHLANADDNSIFKWNIDGLKNNGFLMEQFDIIGMSLYPNETDWKSKVDGAYTNMLDMKSRYGVDVMLVEVGFPSNKPTIAHQFLTYVIEKTKQAYGLGVFYWEPIAHNNWKGYSKGAWDADGSPSVAMDAFLDMTTLSTSENRVDTNLLKIYPNPSYQYLNIVLSEGTLNTIRIYNLKGHLIKKYIKPNITNTIDVSHFSSGMYLIKINHFKTFKFIKE